VTELATHSYISEDNIRMNKMNRVYAWTGCIWIVIGVEWRRFLNAVMNHRIQNVWIS
jgi:drug/metabolite transporter superfamily protein YnfA